MNKQRGFSTIIVIVVLGLVVLAGVGYVLMNPEALQTPMQQNTETSIAWKFTEAAEVDGIPHTTVAVTVNGTTHAVGTFTGSCSEIGASGGIDGKGLLAGELSAAQCWFAGGGDEIGVFAEEDGSRVIMVGGLGEGEEGSGMFRGDFEVRSDIKL